LLRLWSQKAEVRWQAQLKFTVRFGEGNDFTRILAIWEHYPDFLLLVWVDFNWHLQRGKCAFWSFCLLADGHWAASRTPGIRQPIRASCKPCCLYNE
jgi:hypothetical protein